MTSLVANLSAGFEAFSGFISIAILASADAELICVGAGYSILKSRR
jgi:hypothetical protein